MASVIQPFHWSRKIKLQSPNRDISLVRKMPSAMFVFNGFVGSGCRWLVYNERLRLAGPVSVYTVELSTCLEEEKEERVLEKEALSVTERFFVITSRVSPSQLSVVLLVVVVSNVSLDSFMKKPEVSSKFSWKMSSEMPSLTLSTPRGRPSPLWMSSMPWNVKDVPCTDSVDKLWTFDHQQDTNGPFQDHQHIPYNSIHGSNAMLIVVCCCIRYMFCYVFAVGHMLC